MPPKTVRIATQQSILRVHALRLVLIACSLLALSLGSPRPALAQFSSTVDNKGTEFFMAFLPQHSGGAHAVELHLTADVATDVTIQYPANAPTFDATVTVQPGSIEVISLPEPASNQWTSDTVSSNLVRAFSDREFVAYMINLYPQTSDAALALPVDALNTDYIVASKNSYLDEFSVFAPSDDTTVTITPTAAFGSRAAGVPFDVVLNRGEAYFAQASAEFSGTLVSASRPVGLTNGNYCTQIPGAGGYGACDHIFEVAQPVQTWGNVVPVTNLPRRDLGSIYRVYAAEDETTVFLDGAPLEPVLNHGQYLEVSNATLEGETDLTGSHVFSSELPIFVVQFMTGVPDALQSDPGGGDPAMGNMIPSDQYLTSYTFATPGAGQFADHFLTVIANDDDLDTITLDGQPIGGEAFSSIPGSGFSAALIQIQEGTHTTASAHGHGITVEGFGSYDSYLYPGGARFQAINTTDANPPLCSLMLESSDPVLYVGTGTDDRPSEDTNGDGELDPAEDLNDNGVIDVDTGIFSVTLGEGSQNLTLTLDPNFLPLDPTVSFEVAPTEPGFGFEGSIIVQDGAQNSCTLVIGESEPYPTADWAEAFDLWTYEVDDNGAERTIGFLAARSDGVHVLDVTNPEIIVPLGVYAPELCEDSEGAEWLFHADEVTFAPQEHAIHVSVGACGVHIVDVADARNPGDLEPQSFEPRLLEVYDRHVAGSLSWVEAVAVGDGLAYVADYDALRIFDVSEYDGDPTTSDIGPALGTLGIDRASGGPVGNVVLYDDGEQLLALVATRDGMRIVNVDDPGNPTVISSYQHPTDPNLNPISQDIAVDPEQLTVLLPAWVGGLPVLDISDTPEEIDRLPTAVAYYTAVPYAGKIYATEGTEGLRVLELVDGVLEPVPSSDPIDVGNPGVDWAWNVVVANCTAYVTFGTLGIGPEDPHVGGLQITPLPPEDCEASDDGGLQGGQTDDDLDGVADVEDNCLGIANADQTDSNLDGFGNACDADYDLSGSVGLGDFGIFSAAYGATSSDAHYDARADHNSDGEIGLLDFGVFSQRWGVPSGPSGLACAGSVPCP